MSNFRKWQIIILFHSLIQIIYSYIAFVDSFAIFIQIYTIIPLYSASVTFELFITVYIRINKYKNLGFVS